MSNTEITESRSSMQSVGLRTLAVLLAASSSRDGKDESKINKDVVENIEKVQGAFFNSGHANLWYWYCKQDL